MTLNSFRDFVESVRGYQPFDWQCQLAESLVTGSIPAVIDVPTGLGKTAVIDCWAFALGHGADLPRRLAFVVDRKIIVDDTHAFVSDLSRSLADRGAEAAVSQVGERLRSLSGTESALEAVRMRGGVTWDSRWIADPRQPSVITGTVDQFGSRVLFRGYGTSRGMRPIDAALTATDCWLVVDEAHMSNVLVETMSAVAERSKSERPLAITQMSATPSVGEDQTLVADLDREMTNEHARKRILAEKPAGLVDLAWLDKKPGKNWRTLSRNLGLALAALATSHVDLSVNPRVGIVCNTVGTARSAHQALIDAGQQSVLLTGRVRGYERDRIVAEDLVPVRAGNQKSLASPLFVVATQTIEVGVNLDFDHLITELAPLSSLIQRFGRMNRFGGRTNGKGMIVRAGFAHNEDPIYGSASQATWDFLAETSIASSGDTGFTSLTTIEKKTGIKSSQIEPTLDMGIRASVEHRNNSPSSVEPEKALAPVILASHLDRWAWTKPEPLPDQPVAPFLHGPGRVDMDVQVAWRSEPPNIPNPQVGHWKEWVAVAPPMEWEFVTVPLTEAKSLLGQIESPLLISDQEGVPSAEADEETMATASGIMFYDEIETAEAISARALRPGMRIIFAPSVGGHDEWGWTGHTDEVTYVPDVADLYPDRRSGLLRVTPEILESWSGSSADEFIQKALDSLAEIATFDEWNEVKTEIQSVLSGTQWGIAVREAMGDETFQSLFENGLPSFRNPADDTIVAPLVLLTGKTSDIAGVDEGDDLASSQVGERLTLSRHGEDVGATARRWAQALDLGDPLVKAVELAARWHDLGKADPRFQVALWDGASAEADTAPELLAKSGRSSSDPVSRIARRLAKVPVGFRHEAVSELIVADFPTESFDGVDRELVLYLIASHHGHARPLLPPLIDPDPQVFELRLNDMEVHVVERESQIDWSHPDRFHKLNRRYGWWGLARLEMIVRLADMWCSEYGRSIDAND